MTLRSIDTQLSISRAMDVGNVQNQLTQKPSVDQMTAAAQANRQQEMDRTRSNQVDKTAEAKIRDNQSRENGAHSNKDQSNENHPEEEHNKSDHPYKGRFIDFSL